MKAEVLDFSMNKEDKNVALDGAISKLKKPLEKAQ